MDVVLLIVDSLRARSLRVAGAVDGVDTPALARLSRTATYFRRAYAADCWTLPTHVSMFTGLLPSEHGAHFQHLAYTGAAPTLAELFAAAGYETEIATRNPVLDGSIPGVTRGFRRHSIALSPRSAGLNPLAIMLALSKPRFRRQVRQSGFFNAGQRESRDFIRRFARATVPADRELLALVIDRMRGHRAAGRRFFIAANLYDVHAPYPPRDGAIFRSWLAPRHWEENLVMPAVLPKLGGHRYLAEGFSLPERHRRLLLGRYRDGIRLLDDKLAAFFAALDAYGLRDDLLLVVTSDHGEAFGEHGLYLHDASVWDVHLHVPLWVVHPRAEPTVVDEPVSTRSLFDLVRRTALDGAIAGTMLDADWRRRHAVVLAEHHYYPHAEWIAARHRRNLHAAIAGSWKAIADERDDTVTMFDLARDPTESAGERGTWADFSARCGASAGLASALAERRRHRGGEARS
jgi:arylsulfatase A-like enzyme